MTDPRGSDLIQILRAKRADDPLSLRKRRIKRTLAATLVIGATALSVWHIRERIAPGQHQFAIETHGTVRNGRGQFLRDAVLAVTTVTFLTSGTSFTRPQEWNAGNNSIECIGGGQGGQNGSFTCCSATGGNGGVGGGYAKSSNLAIGATVTYAIGAGGVANLGNGGNTTWNTTTIVARGGGTATAQVGTTTRLGGAGGTHLNADAAGGGGAAGPNAAGVNGVNGSGIGNGGAGGRGDGTFGGTGGTGGASGANGGAGNPGTEYDASHGSGGGGGGGGGALGSSLGGQGGLYGGAGGGGVSICPGTGGVGRQGLIVVTNVTASKPYRNTMRFFTQRF